MRKSRTSLIGHRRLGLRIFVSKVFHAISLIKWNLVWKLNIWPCILYHNRKQCTNRKQNINGKLKQTTGKRFFFISRIVVVIYIFFIKFKILHNANHIIFINKQIQYTLSKITANDKLDNNINRGGFFYNKQNKFFVCVS